MGPGGNQWHFLCGKGYEWCGDGGGGKFEGQIDKRKGSTRGTGRDPQREQSGQERSHTHRHHDPPRPPPAGTNLTKARQKRGPVSLTTS